MNLLRRRRGQSMSEYAIVFTVVVTAIIAMQLYVKRGLQGKVRDVSDALKKEFGAIKVDDQYEPYYAITAYTVDQSQNVVEEYKAKGLIDRESVSEKVTRTGSGKTGGAGALGDDDDWIK